MKTKSFVLVLIVIVIGLLLPNVTQSHAVQSAPDQLWNEIIELHKKAAELLEKEKADPSNAAKIQSRMAAFWTVATKLDSYVAAYVKDTTSVTYLRTRYRYAIYSELAGLPQVATIVYKECLKHPMINSTDAVFDGEPISKLAQERLKVTAREPQPVAAEPRTSRSEGRSSEPREHGRPDRP